MKPAQMELRGVSKRYGERLALADASLRVAEGEHTAIVGTSGCGKSTLLRIVAGLEAPSSGQVLLGGKVASDAEIILLPPHRRGIAMVFQDLALWPNLSVRENVLLGLGGGECPPTERRGRADAALAICGIAELADRKPGSLSGGQQQRAALARALAVRPAFLFLDEPFAGLDPVTKEMLSGEIAALASEHAFTILLVTHDPFEATDLCTIGVLLEEGRVRERGRWGELVRDSQAEILRSFRRHLSSGSGRGWKDRC
jgi:ABC-type Fe3+/spermidine/putrescine transport system ATPase subunit